MSLIKTIFHTVVTIIAADATAGAIRKGKRKYREKHGKAIDVEAVEHGKAVEQKR